MKKLKTIFSPRKLVAWLFILCLIITIPEISRPAMSKTEAIVTLICVEKKDDEYEVATTVLTPGQDKKANYQIYTGKGTSTSDAINRVSATLGKDMGFAQCEILAFGENICNEGVMPSLDYFTRIKKISGNAVLIAFNGETADFAQSVSNLNTEKSLRFDDIMNHDKYFAFSTVSNVDAFYRGYYEKTGLGIMPLVRLKSNEDLNAIQVASVMGDGSGQQSSGSQTGQNANNEKKYIINDGTAIVFDKGIKKLEIDREMGEKINLFLNGAQEAVIEVDGLKDDLYDGEKVLVKVNKKRCSFSSKFEGGKPILKAKIDMAILIEEVDKVQPDHEFLTRNKEFLTNKTIEKLKETVENTFKEAATFCAENEIDILGVYKNFNAFNYKKFKAYYEEKQEKYLEGIDYQISVKVSSDY